MKNKTGIIGGFVIGVAGFLLAFKLIILDAVPPSDELAPGIVMLAAFFNGFLFASAGHSIQQHLRQRAITLESE